MQFEMKPPVGVLRGLGAGGKTFHVSAQTGTAMVDPDSVASLTNAGWTTVSTFPVVMNPTRTGFVDPVMGVTIPLAGTPCESFGASPAASASVNTMAIQSALTMAGRITITVPGLYKINSTLHIPSNTSVYIARGVIIVRLAGGNASTIFDNANPTTGDVNISLTGEGTLYCNANGYVATYNANTTDCPYIPELFAANIPGIIESGGSLNASNPTMNGVHFDNVNGLFVGGGLRIMQPAKYQLYGSALTNFMFDGIEVYGDDTINPANGSTLGRDGIHIQGNSRKGIIRNIKGTTNDDFVVVNARDILGMVSPRSIGTIDDVVIENIRGRVIRRGGAGVHIYGGLDVGTASPANTNNYDVAPAITNITNASGVATVTTATAHGMEVGQFFYISSASPAGYNTGTAAQGSTPGVVASVIDPTHFTYNIASGTAAYVSGAVLVRYYRVHNIKVRNVNVRTYSAAAVQMSTFGAGNFGVIDSPSIENITGICDTPSGVGVVAIDTCRTVDLVATNVISQNQTLYPIFNGNYSGSPHLAGRTVLRNFVAKTPYKPDSASGQCWIVPGYYENMSIEDMDVTIKNGGGGWTYAISASNVATSSLLTINRPKLSDVDGQNAYIFTNQLVTPGTVVINGANFGTNSCSVASMGGSITSGNLFLNNCAFGAQTAVILALYGTGQTVSLNGNSIVSDSAGFIYSNTVGAYTLLSAGNNNFGTAALFGAGSTGNFTLKGFDLKADVTAVPVVRADGAYCYYTNTVGWTAGATAGIAYCQGTAAGSWKQLTDATKSV